MIGDILKLFGGDLLNLADKKFKTKAEAEEAVRDFATKHMSALSKIDVAQTRVNIAEQKHGSRIGKLWRPLTGLAASLAFWLIGVIIPVIANAVRLADWWREGTDFVPYLPDWQIVGCVLLGMLGLTTYRTVEKAKGLTQ